MTYYDMALFLLVFGAAMGFFSIASAIRYGRANGAHDLQAAGNALNWCIAQFVGAVVLDGFAIAVWAVNL